MIYLKFDANNIQIAMCNLEGAAPEGDGWVALNGAMVDGAIYKLVNGAPTPLTGADKDAAILQQTWGARMDALRAARDSALRASDWTQVADAPVDQTAWANYRQALRDLPSTVSASQDPNQVNLPTAPSA